MRLRKTRTRECGLEKQRLLRDIQSKRSRLRLRKATTRELTPLQHYQNERLECQRGGEEQRTTPVGQSAIPTTTNAPQVRVFKQDVPISGVITTETFISQPIGGNTMHTTNVTEGVLNREIDIEEGKEKKGFLERMKEKRQRKKEEREEKKEAKILEKEEKKSHHHHHEHHHN